MKTASVPEVRITVSVAEKIRREVVWRAGREPVVFGLARRAEIGATTVLLIKNIFTLPDEAYVQTRTHGAKWSGGAMRSILNEAIQQQCGIVMLHLHPVVGPVELSNDDRQSAQQLLPTFQNLIRELPHASIVLGFDHAAGLVLAPNDEVYEGPVSIRWLGPVVTEFPPPDELGGVEASADIFHRQVLVIGAKGQRRLAHARIVVVGLGGGGSHVVQQLAHMGVGEIIGIDGDRVEATNRGRLVGMTWWDTLLWRRLKTAVMRRMVWRINRSVRFTAVPFALPERTAVDAVKGADVIVGCLDTLHARSDLQDLSWRFLIPYVDIGLLIQPQSEECRFSIGGHVATLIPGSFCQWCIGMLSEDKLKKEAGGRPRSYLKDSNVQAQVVSMNGVLASQAASEVMQLLTGFAPIDPQATFKKFDGLEGTLAKWAVKQSSKCACCSGILGAGDPVWQSA